MRTSYRAAALAEVNAAKALAVAAETENRDLSDVERDTIEGHLSKAQEIDANGKKEEALRKQMADLSTGLGLVNNLDADTGITDPESPAGKRAKRLSVGASFAESAQYKDMLKNAPKGGFSEKARVHSQAMELAGGYKDLFYSGDREASAGFLVENDRRGLLDPFYERPLSVRALFASGNTTSDTIEYVRMTSVTNNAAVVPEARSTAPIDGTTVTDAIGGLKPESSFEFDRDSTGVKTIAHWIPITKRALADASQIRTMIDSFLRYGLEETFEDELLTGSGAGEHFLGLYNTPGIQTQAAPTGTQDNMDILRMARRKVRIGGRAVPTAYVMNPVDWEDVELLRNGNGDFYGGGPFNMSTPRIWGLPIIESEAVTPGTAWCAAWNWGVIYDREQASVQATDSHADFFVRNLVAILAEFRAAFAVLRPSAFVKITLG